jgi:hypothetical protein
MIGTALTGTIIGENMKAGAEALAIAKSTEYRKKMEALGNVFVSKGDAAKDLTK